MLIYKKQSTLELVHTSFKVFNVILEEKFFIFSIIVSAMIYNLTFASGDNYKL
jgi:hypothetical protein